MEPHLDFYQNNPVAIQTVTGLEKALAKNTLEKSLTELIRLCTLQINGCAYCADLHTADAREGGEDDRRLATVSVWHETPFFTDRECAVPAWTEVVTSVIETRMPDNVWRAVRVQLSDAEPVDLMLLVSTINTWNRLVVSFCKLPARTVYILLRTANAAPGGHMLHNVRTLGINIERHFDDVATLLVESLNFPIWATGLPEGLTPVMQGSGMVPDERIAKAAPSSGEGSAFIRFSPPNTFGIVDHWVRLPDGSIICVPLHVVCNGAGTTVSFTLFQQPNMDDAQFDADIEWVQRDPVKLKTALEAE